MKQLVFDVAADPTGEHGGGTPPAGGEQPAPGETKPAGTPPAGGEQPAPGETKPAGTPPAGGEQPAPGETKPAGTPPAGGEQPKPGEQPKNPSPKNLMDDEPPAGGEQPAPGEGGAAEQELQAFADGIRAIDLGEGVTFDDAALAAMRAPLMELCGKDPKKAEALVKAYTGYRREEMRQAQERDNAFNDGLVAEAEKRFGKDLRQMVQLAKAGGERIFGDELWRQMRAVPQFANNPDIIERLAAFGRTVKDDRGAVKKEGSTVTQERDWRERMYGKKQ